jgi:hypothetical protein
MKNENRDGTIFLYVQSNGEYACYGFELEEYMNGGKVKLLYAFTDMPDLFEIVDNFTREGGVVDVFENKILKDAFLMTLNYIMADTGFPEKIDKMVNDWYFSDNPKYKVLPDDYKLWD